MTVISNAPSRALITAPAAALLKVLEKQHGELLIHQSGGCCDGSSPMCYPVDQFLVGDLDVLLEVLDVGDGGVPVWISGPQFEVWKHTQVVIDTVPGRGAGFSVESPTGMRFISRARAFTDREKCVLEKNPPLTGAEYIRGRRPQRPIVYIAARTEVDDCPLSAE